MFFVEYFAALVKILFQVAFAIITAIPFRIAWNCVAGTYLVGKLPETLYDVPYWDVVAIILTCTYVGELINLLTPKFVNVTNTNNAK